MKKLIESKGSTRSSKILGLLVNNYQDNVQSKKEKKEEKTKLQEKKISSIPAYVDLFDKGAWEELDSVLRKQSLDENLQRKKPWGREYKDAVCQPPIHNSFRLQAKHNKTDPHCNSIQLNLQANHEVTDSPCNDVQPTLLVNHKVTDSPCKDAQPSVLFNREVTDSPCNNSQLNLQANHEVTDSPCNDAQPTLLFNREVTDSPCKNSQPSLQANHEVTDSPCNDAQPTLLFNREVTDSTCNDVRPILLVNRAVTDSPCNNSQPSFQANQEVTDSPCKDAQPTVLFNREVTDSPCNNSQLNLQANHEVTDSPCNDAQPTLLFNREVTDSPCKNSQPSLQANHEVTDSPCNDAQPTLLFNREVTDSTCNDVRPILLVNRAVTDSPCNNSQPSFQANQEVTDSPCNNSQLNLQANHEVTDSPCNDVQPTLLVNHKVTDSPCKDAQPTVLFNREVTDSPCNNSQLNLQANHEVTDSPCNDAQPTLLFNREVTDSPCKNSQPSLQANHEVTDSTCNDAQPTLLVNHEVTNSPCNGAQPTLQVNSEVTHSQGNNSQLDTLPIGESITIEVSASPYVNGGKVLFSSPTQPNLVSDSSSSFYTQSMDRDFEESFQLLENHSVSDEVIFNINAAESNTKKRKKRCDRQNCCIFCGLLLTNLTRHITRKHCDEKDVARYLALLEEVPLESAIERKTIMENLRLKGNHEYNISLLNKATPNQPTNEQLLPSKRPPVNKTKNNTDYIFCNLCLGMFMRKSFYRHAAVCVEKKKELPTSSSMDLKDQSDLNFTNSCYIKKYGHNFDPSTKEILPLMKDKIIPLLRKDHCGLVALNDELIVAICNDYLLSHRDVKDHTLVTRKMRDGSKLLMAICNLEPSISCLQDIYDSSYVNTVMKAIEEVCACTDDGDVGIIGMPPRLMWVLSEGARKLVDQVLTSPDKSDFQKKHRREQINQFMEVVRGRWKYSIGTNAEKSRKRKKMVKEKIMPSINDLKIFSKALRNRLDKCYINLQNTQSVVNYEQLCKVIIALIITINARRPLEAAKIEIDFFLNRIKTNTTDEELLSLLDVNERKAFNSLSLFTVPGKREQDASILLTKEMEQGIELIVECREELGVSSDCKFLFARPNLENTFDGSSVMREMRSLCTLERPEFMTSTGLRHLVATRSLAKGKDFTTHVSKFMSHTLDIHNKNYAFPLDVINKGKVGHFLLELQGLDGDLVQNNKNPKSQSSNKKEFKKSDTNFIQYEEIVMSPSFNEISGLSKDVLMNNDFGHDPSYGPEVNLSSNEDEETPVKKKKANNCKRIPWTDEEKEVVLSNFMDCIKSGHNPGTIRCRELINAEPRLHNRTANQINTLMDNYNRGRTKLPPKFAYILEQR